MAKAKKRTKKRAKKPAKKPKKLLIKRKPKKGKIKKRITVRKKAKKKLLKKKRPALRLKKRKVRRAWAVISQPKSVVQANEPFPAESFFKAKIKVIGIGGGGGSIVSEIGRSLHKATFVVADTDVRSFKKRQGIKYFLFGQELTHGLGTGLNTELGRKAAEQEKEKITKLFKDQDIVIFIASLGGGLGSSATKVFADAAKDFGGITFGIFTLPFKFEGAHKHKIATKALRELRDSLNVSITIPNEKIFKIIDATTAITDAFSMVNKNLIESLESLIDLIYNPGIINIDFADLRVILRGMGNSAFLNTAQAQGNDRADAIIKEILHNPLYQNSNFTAQKVLFNIAGGANLGMVEVDKISRAISQKNPKAKIIFGISRDSSLKNKIKTTLLMTGQPPGADLPPEPQKTELADSKIATKPNKQKRKPQTVEKKKITRKIKKPARKVALPPVEIPGFLPNVSVPETVGRLSVAQVAEKKAIRRTALEAKKAEEIEENKKSKQEEEWEIPAFLRLKK